MYIRGNNMKKTAVLAVMAIAFILPLGLAGCDSNEQTADEALIEFADKFAGDMISGDLSKIAEDSYVEHMSRSEFEHDLKVFYDNSTWDQPTKDICDQILSTLKYDVDENTVFASYEKGTGEIDITFEYVDYESLYDLDNASDAGTYLDFLKNYDKTVKKTVTLDCVYDDGFWYAADHERVFLDVFEWKDFHFDFVKNYLDYIDSVTWFHEDGSGIAEYTNSVYIELDISVLPSNIEWTKDCFFKVFKDGEQLYDMNLQASSRSGYYWCGYSSTWMDGGDALKPGTYDIKLYDFKGNVILDRECTVK